MWSNFASNEISYFARFKESNKIRHQIKNFVARQYQLQTINMHCILCSISCTAYHAVSAPEYKYAASRCIEKLLHSFTLSRTHSLHGPSFTPHSPSTSWCWRAAFQECTAYHLGLRVIRRWWKRWCCCASLQECTADHKSPKWLIFPLGLACRTPIWLLSGPVNHLFSGDVRTETL